MAKYRRKALTLDCEQFLKDRPIPNGIVEIVSNQFIVCNAEYQQFLPIRHNDWIVYGVDGFNYPLSPELFKKLFEVNDYLGEG